MEVETMEQSNEVTDGINLGEQITLSGFRAVDRGSMVILKKMIGNHVRKISDSSETFESIKFVLKPVHETEASKVYDIHCQLIDNGKSYNAEVGDRNVFIAVNKALTKIEEEMKK